MLLLISMQLLSCRSQVWLPRWILQRRITYRRLRQALALIQPVAKATDRLLRPRMTALVEQPGTYAVALICALIGITMPIMEVVPFAATAAGAAISLFGVALVARDGLVMLLAVATCLAGVGVFWRTLL